MLKVENIDVYYGAIHAVKNVSFEVGDGEIVALIGANGAGKSTLMRRVGERMEQAALRREYIDSVLGNLKSQLDHTYVVDDQGNKRKLKQKED